MNLIHGNIHTMENGVIQDGYLITRGDTIIEVGSMKNLKQIEGETIDLLGRDVYPGFIDAHTHLGMFEDGLCFEGDDGNEETDPVTPQLRALDAVNPMDRCFGEALLAGVTTVVTGPGSANAVSGQLMAVKTAGKRIDRMVVKAPAAMKFALGENPKSVYHDKSQSPMTRMATAALVREALQKAQRYLTDKQLSEENSEEYDLPEYDAKCEALLPLLKGELVAHFHAHRADDIFTAIRLSKEFHLRYVIVHGTEGHLIAEELKEEGCPVLSGPLLCDRSKPELRELTPRTPGILSEAGVPVAIVTDHPVIPIQYLPLCAGLAVREGMAHEKALEAITITPARICGIDNLVGSLMPGKQADFSVFSCDPLSLFAKPDMVFCSGKQVK